MAKKVYDPDKHPKQIGLLYEYGLTVDQVAKVLCIAKDTLVRWARVHPEVKIQTERKEIFDVGVEKALHGRIIGMKTRETRTTKDRHGNIVSVIETVKDVPPHVPAIIFWLKNRHPERWSEDPLPQNKIDDININITVDK